MYVQWTDVHTIRARVYNAHLVDLRCTDELKCMYSRTDVYGRAKV